MIFSSLMIRHSYSIDRQTVNSPISIRQLLSRSDSNLTLRGAAGAQDPKILTPTSASAQKNGTPLPLRKLFTRPVIVAAGNYAALSLVDITLRAVQPVFFSTPIHLGGLGLSPQKIGMILSVYGILNGLLQIFFFARIHDRFGSKRTYITGICAALPIFALFPIINILARHQGYSLSVWFAVALQCWLSIVINFSYGEIFVLFFHFGPFLCSLPLTMCSESDDYPSRLCLHLHHRFVSE